MGAWIETGDVSALYDIDKSHPSWVRGLKQLIKSACFDFESVAPLVGAWIETRMAENLNAKTDVAPLVGAWIETANR